MNVRVLAATNRCPVEAVEAGHLREDIYYRLAVVMIKLPPLRERGEDVATLADYFLAELNERHGTRKRFSEAMRSRLAQIRMARQRAPAAQRRRARIRAVRRSTRCRCRFRLGAGSRQCVRGTAHASRHDALSITLPIGSSLDDIERTFIVATLEHFGGDKRRAASALGCSVKTLYNKLHLYRRQLGHVAAAS